MDNDSDLDRIGTVLAYSVFIVCGAFGGWLAGVALHEIGLFRDVSLWWPSGFGLASGFWTCWRS